MSLHDTLNKIRSAPVPKNEETAKFHILAPVLYDLGWDSSGQEVLFEYAVGGKGGGRVDIALDGPDHIVALIEAKAPGQDLSKHVDQVIGYAFHQGVDICVLTTGLEWWLYLPMEKGPPEKRLFVTLRIAEDRIEQLSDDLQAFLGRDNLLNGQAGRKAKQVLKARHLADRMKIELPKIWKSMVDGPDEELVALVRQRAYEKLDLRPDGQQVAAVLRGSPVPPVVLPGPGKPKPPVDPPEPPSEAPISTPKPKPRRTPTPSTRPSGIRLWGEQYEVKYWIDVLRIVAEALHQRHGTDFDLVLAHRSKRGNPHASRNPDDLRHPTQVGATGIYLDKNLNAAAVRRRAEFFMKLLGHRPSDLEILFD